MKVSDVSHFLRGGNPNSTCKNRTDTMGIPVNIHRDRTLEGGREGSLEESRKLVNTDTTTILRHRTSLFSRRIQKDEGQEKEGVTLKLRNPHLSKPGSLFIMNR